MNYETTNSENKALAVISHEWTAAQTVNGLTEYQRKEHIALIKVELAALRTAYPTQARNFSDEEVTATTNLWLDIFSGIDPRLLHEAVKRFIITDRKAYFPAPGQIVGIVEQIMAERETAEYMRKIEKHQAHLRERLNVSYKENYLTEGGETE